MLLGRVDAKVPLGPTMKETLTPASRAPDRSEHTPSRVLCAHCGLETLVRGKETWGLGSKAIAAEILAAENLAAERLSSRLVQDGSLSLGPNERQESASKFFCCQGCMGAYSLIHQLGLENFYALRSLSDQESEPVSKVRASEILKDLTQAGVQVDALGDGTCRVRLGVEGLHCAACCWLIESLPPTLPGLRSAQVRLSDQSLELIYDPSRTAPFRVAEYLARFGYSLGPWSPEGTEEQTDGVLRREHWFWIAVAFFLAANAMWIGISLYAGESTGIASEHERFLRWVGALLGLLATVFPGRIFFRSAWQSLRSGIPHVDVPVATGLLVGTIGSLVGAATGRGHVYFDSLASLVLLLRVGRYIQFRAQYRSGVSIAKLLRFHDIEAIRLSEDGGRNVVLAKNLLPGDRVEVRAGVTIPADGIVSSGQSELQTAFITGESRPQRVRVGDSVIGGSLNLSSTIEMTVERTVQEGRLGQISDWVQEATADRTPLIQLADRVGRVFVWVILGLAILTAGIWSVSRGWEVSVERTVSLLTIACPCALALAAPLVITVAIGRAAKEKIWIRDGNSLERLAKPGLMCLDKTGTLTFGDLRVIDWSGPRELLLSIARIELESEHPVARALVDYVRSEIGAEEFDRRIDSVRVSQVRQEAGRGIYGRVDGSLVFIGRSETPIEQRDTSREVSVWVDGQSQGKFRLGDSIRPNLVSSLRQIRDRGWKLAILSGDDSPQVQQIADALSAGGVELVACHGGLSPEQKTQRLGELRSEGTTTVMVGDGINDAVALAAADVGIAVRGPCELAMKNAPIFIGERHLEAIPRLLDASHNAVRAIHRCFAASLLYNALTVGLAMTGYIHPLIAAIFMPISGITVLMMAWSARTFPHRQEKNS